MSYSLTFLNGVNSITGSGLDLNAKYIGSTRLLGLMAPIEDAPQWLSFLSVFGGCLLCLVYITLARKKTQRAMLPLPPGPKGKPVIKNLLDVPSNRPWDTITKWSKNYGDIIYMNIAGMHIIYLNSFEDAVNLLEKRSSIYSDRTETPMQELMGISDTLFALTPYGDDWRLRRRIFHQEFNSTTSSKFKATQLEYTHIMLGLIKNNPASYDSHFKHFSAGIILKTVYGFKIKTMDDPYVHIAKKGVRATEGLLPGQFLVDLFPFLKYLPDWMPGTKFKKLAKLWGKDMIDSCRIPFEEITKSYLEGTAAPSFTTTWLSKISNIPQAEERKKLSHAIQVTAGTTFLAGYETSFATLLNLTLHMIRHPDIQRKAQDELDKVVGRGRLPDFDDKESLPYIDALCKEVLRWHPIVTLIPHSVTVDDEYKGMRIPKGSLILGNIWAMSRNKDQYGPDPDAFRPERFLESNIRNPAQYIFGFGRRICPGRYMAENSIFIAISCILHVFSIVHAVDEDGKEIPIEPHWINSMVSHLAPFSASFNLRFEGAERLINVDE